MKTEAPSVKMVINGDLHIPSCLGFIALYVQRLDLDSQVTHANRHSIALGLQGHAELIDMLEMACWLGPETSQIQSVTVSVARCAST
ncbi:MAG: hypothetical protein OXE84_05970 [Rhodobacteraceae bacterium]|nr:hypothetical protein [Paracoccaceae bacterium]MCY4198127.1 hypothetical protein [Paracoccaceae bacterium]